MLPLLPAAVLALPHAPEIGGAGVVTCIALIWGVCRQRSNPNSSQSSNETHQSVGQGGAPTSAMYNPPPDPNAFTNNSDYASALSQWNLSEMHRINLPDSFVNTFGFLFFSLQGLPEGSRPPTDPKIPFPYWKINHLRNMSARFFWSD